VAERHGPGDGQPETGATLSTATGLVDPDERLEDGSPVLAGDAGAVVVDVEHHRITACVQPHIDARRRMTDGVAHQVVDQLVQPGTVAVDAQCPWKLRDDRDRGDGRELVGHLAYEPGQVDIGQVDPVHLLGARE
jgi:hypothetical protein